jgi:hypothetical protein
LEPPLYHHSFSTSRLSIVPFGAIDLPSPCRYPTSFTTINIPLLVTLTSTLVPCILRHYCTRTTRDGILIYYFVLLYLLWYYLQLHGCGLFVYLEDYFFKNLCYWTWWPLMILALITWDFINNDQSKQHQYRPFVSDFGVLTGNYT